MSYFQFLFLPQLHASRAISGYSVPIIGCVIGGVGAVLRRYGPESMGGVGDFGARIDAETARTGLSDEEVSDKVHMYIFLFRLANLISKDILPYRRKTG
jgi:hypothetical protein